jgi:hypothetical protein
MKENPNNVTAKMRAYLHKILATATAYCGRSMTINSIGNMKERNPIRTIVPYLLSILSLAQMRFSTRNQMLYKSEPK